MIEFCLRHSTSLLFLQIATSSPLHHASNSYTRQEDLSGTWNRCTLPPYSHHRRFAFYPLRSQNAPGTWAGGSRNHPWRWRFICPRGRPLSLQTWANCRFLAWLNCMLQLIGPAVLNCCFWTIVGNSWLRMGTSPQPGFHTGQGKLCQLRPWYYYLLQLWLLAQKLGFC